LPATTPPSSTRRPDPNRRPSPHAYSWSDAKTQHFTATYDALSRLLTRTEPDSTASWVYGSSATLHNIGRVQCMVGFSATNCSTTGTGYREDNTYDSFGRPQVTTLTEDAAYSIGYAYNTAGQLGTLTYPVSTNGCALTVNYGYQYGVLASVTDASSVGPCGPSNGTLWQATGVDPRGQVSAETLGNHVKTLRAFNAVTGFPTSIQAGVNGGTGTQNETYLFDGVGNMTQRQDNNAGLTESFCYDSVNRLNHSTLTGVCTGAVNLQMGYDVMGNITSRSDVAAGASWTYDPTHKHQVTQSGSPSLSYVYDPNGNVQTRNGFPIHWTAANFPDSLASGGKIVSYYYAPDRSHYQQTYTSGGTMMESTQYIGGLLEKVTAGSTIDWRHYIAIGDSAVAVIDRSNSGTNLIRYALQDALGSLTKITDNAGSTYEAESYCPYGGRRDSTTWSGAPSCVDLGKMKLFSRVGFTGQDMIGGNSMDLIHLNGRVEDAVTGRMLSADPYITTPVYTQNFNRYSYVNNNPLSFVDPSGFGPTIDCDKDAEYEGGGGQSSEDAECAGQSLPDTGGGGGPGHGPGSGPSDNTPGGPGGHTPPPPPPCTEGPSTASGAVQGEVYTPEGGGSLAAGVEDGRVIGMGRAGLGGGDGFTYNPRGALPMKPPESGGGGVQVAATVQGGLTFRIPYTNLGFSFGAQLGFGWDSNGGFAAIHDFDKALGFPAKAGWERYGSAGITAAAYSGRATAITNTGTCRAHF